MPLSKILLCVGIAFLGLASPQSFAQTMGPSLALRPRPLLVLNEGADKRVTPSSAQVTPTASQQGLVVNIAPGPDNYPGIAIKQLGDAWNLADYGHVETRLTNLGKADITLSLRVDNAGDWRENPWNTESVTLKPGDARTLKTIFGYAYGYKPNFPLKPEAVVNLLIFAGKSEQPQSFRVETVLAAGPAGEKPPVDPETIRVKPEKGVLLNGIWPVNLDAAGQTAYLTHPTGRWDLRDFLEVHLKLKNTSQTTFTPRARLDSNGGSSHWISASAPLPPGAETEIVLPFTNGEAIDLDQKETKERVASNSVSAVAISTEGGEGKRTIEVESVQAVLPPTPTLPDWLGTRPPVDGDWVQTLNENFDGPTLDTSKWEIYTENYWDKVSHFSKDNMILANGTATLHMEKKRGFDLDDPKRKETDYAVGYLGSFGKWTQRYGYFEARLKLPTAPGLWPAFWMMPDRGAGANNRGDTRDGGMEFDIMEYLSGWGPNRYNIANHWDGYDKDHRSDGSDKIYLQPDKEGFITCGLLWLPGEVVYYGNGHELLRWKNERVANVPAHFLFDMVIGGWDNLPLDDAQLPADFTIDYVRAWQRQDLASPVDNNGPN